MRALQFHFRIVFSNSFCVLFSHNCWLTEKNPTESRTDYSRLHIAGAWHDSQQQTWLFVLEILADFLDGNSEAPLSPHTSPQAQSGSCGWVRGWPLEEPVSGTRILGERWEKGETSQSPREKTVSKKLPTR